VAKTMYILIDLSSSGNAGSYPITFTLMDVDYLTADYSFTLTVALCPPVFASVLANQVAPQGQTVIYSLPLITCFNPVTIQTTDGSGNAIPSYFSMAGDAVSGL
jgi:hypothetical protein